MKSRNKMHKFEMRDLNSWKKFSRFPTQNHCDVEMKHQKSQGAEDRAQAAAARSLPQLRQAQFLQDHQHALSDIK